MIPACVQTCPSEALYFGDLNDPKSQGFKTLQKPPSLQIEEELGTEPKVFYLKEGEWDEG